MNSLSLYISNFNVLLISSMKRQKVWKREEEGEDVEFNTSKRVERSAFISVKVSCVFSVQIETMQISKN